MPVIRLAHTPLPGMTAYGTSKAALLMLKEYFNIELKPLGIHCGSAMPGVVDTAIQTGLRAYKPEEFPAAPTFQGFFQRSELLRPETAAKFLIWLLMHVENDAFSRGDWNIYDTSHHAEWAELGEVKARQKTSQEIEKGSSPVPAISLSKL